MGEDCAGSGPFMQFTRFSKQFPEKSRVRDEFGKGLAALLLGAVAIGVAPILVRFSEVGPSATAFYRILFALPIIWLISRREVGAPQKTSRTDQWRLMGAGLCFVGDLGIWHWSLQFTTVANSTLLANCAPIFVVLGARIVFGERFTSTLVLGALAAFGGAYLLVSQSVQVSKDHLLGDVLAVVAAVFYAGYLLLLKDLRKRISTATILARSGVWSAAGFALFAALLGEKLVPSSAAGWAVVIALGVVAHLFGQGLIAYGIAHAPAGFSSITLLLQPVVAAILAAWLLQETLGGLQVVGGLVVLGGIFLAAPRGRAGN